MSKHVSVQETIIRPSLTFKRRDLNPPAQCHRAEIFRAGF